MPLSQPHFSHRCHLNLGSVRCADCVGEHLLYLLMHTHTRAYILFLLHHLPPFVQFLFLTICCTPSSMRVIILSAQSMSSSPCVDIFLTHLLFLWFLRHRKANWCSISYSKPKLQSINNRLIKLNNQIICKMFISVNTR